MDFKRMGCQCGSPGDGRRAMCPDYFQLFVIIQMYPYYCNVGQ